MINGKKIKALARVISLGLMIVCIAGSFAGCTPSGGGDTTTADAEPTDNPQTNEEPQTTEEPQTEEPIVTTEEQTQAPEKEPQLHLLHRHAGDFPQPCNICGI